MIVTDQGIVSVGLLDKLTQVFKPTKIKYQVFDSVVADPPQTVVEQAIAYAQSQGCDGVIGFGGGSSLDVAKLVAVILGTNQGVQTIFGIDQVSGQRLPLILVPTTAGTGSEVTPIAIVTTGETTKAGIVAQQLLPDIALLDADLTLQLPAPVTAATGIDAMVHAIEAYTGKLRKNAYSDMLAREALTLLFKHIRTATSEPDNRLARQGMLLGACLAGQSFANSPVAAVHALAYPLGGHFHIPHGLSNALVLTEVMRFNTSHAQSEYAELADYLRFQLSKQYIVDSEHALIDTLEGLITDLGLPTQLRELDIHASDLERLADDAMLQTRLLVNNPRPLAREDALAIYQAVW